MLELWGRDVDDCVGDEFSLLAEFDPFDSAVSAIGTDLSWGDHDLSASEAPDRH